MSDAPQQDPDLTESEHHPLASRPTSGDPADTSARTLRVGAKALVRSRGRVLLVQERRADGSTFWTLPGGGLEPGESPRECLERELDEEIRCGCDLGAILDRCRYRHTTRPDTTTVYLVFEATLDGQPTPNAVEGVVDWCWVRPSAVPAATLDPFERLLADLGDAGSR